MQNDERTEARASRGLPSRRRFDLATIAITPGGWYDGEDKAILAGRKFLGLGRPDAFDEFYTTEFRSAPLSPFQKSYMQSFGHLSENVVAAATSSRYFVV